MLSKRLKDAVKVTSTDKRQVNTFALGPRVTGAHSTTVKETDVFGFSLHKYEATLVVVATTTVDPANIRNDKELQMISDRLQSRLSEEIFREVLDSLKVIRHAAVDCDRIATLAGLDELINQLG